MGVLWSMITQSFPAKPKFTADDIPDLTGKVVIVTGANTGIGKATAEALLAHNAKVYVAGRSREKCEKVIEELREATGKEGHFLHLDLADLKSVKVSAEEFLSKETALHVLFNNAGVMAPPIDQVTVDGYDLQFGTNVLGHFYFTKLLLPLLVSTAGTSADGKARVVTTSSMAQLFCDGLKFDTFKDGPARKKMGTNRLYFQSKSGNVVFAAELARRYGDQGIVSTSLNPGNIRTGLFRYVPFTRRFLNIFLYDPSYGALTQLWAGTSAECATLNGKFLIPWAKVGTPRQNTQNPEIGRELWTWMEEQVERV